jgi:hypothetical protein
VRGVGYQLALVPDVEPEEDEPEELPPEEEPVEGFGVALEALLSLDPEEDELLLSLLPELLEEPLSLLPSPRDALPPLLP